MEDMRVRLQGTPVSGLELALHFRFPLAWIGWEMFIDEKVPDLFSTIPSIERLVLRVADPAKFLVRLFRLRPVALADQLNDSFALIDLLTEQATKITALRCEDVLPDRLVSKKDQSVGHQLPGTVKFPTDSGNEDQWTRCHRSKASIRSRRSEQAQRKSEARSG